MKKVNVLLTKYSDCVSSLIYYLTGRTYTHASLGVNDVYYSFNYRGFCKESIELHRKRGVGKSILYELNVSDEAYQKVCEEIQYFLNHRETFRYTRIGVICCFLHIPYHRKNHYFCSQFVAEVLKNSGSVQLETSPEFYLPGRFFFDLKRNSQVERMVINPI